MIKITDFGLSEDVYERSYFRQGCGKGVDVKLPIKWMAPESLNDGHFSEKSDVVCVSHTIFSNCSLNKSNYKGVVFPVLESTVILATQTKVDVVQEVLDLDTLI